MWKVISDMQVICTNRNRYMRKNIELQTGKRRIIMHGWFVVLGERRRGKEAYRYIERE